MILRAFLLGLLLTTGCAASSQSTTLMPQVSEFHRNLRWKRVEQAVLYVAPEQRSEFLDKYRDRIEVLDIDEYRVDRVEYPRPGEPAYADPATTAIVSVVRFQVELPDVTRQKVTTQERWVYRGKVWLLESGY